jgi:hypothetical protein
MKKLCVIAFAVLLAVSSFAQNSTLEFPIKRISFAYGANVTIPIDPYQTLPIGVSFPLSISPAYFQFSYSHSLGNNAKSFFEWGTSLSYSRNSFIRKWPDDLWIDNIWCMGEGSYISITHYFNPAISLGYNLLLKKRTYWSNSIQIEVPIYFLHRTNYKFKGTENGVSVNTNEKYHSDYEIECDIISLCYTSKVDFYKYNICFSPFIRIPFLYYDFRDAFWGPQFYSINHFLDLTVGVSVSKNASKPSRGNQFFD